MRAWRSLTKVSAFVNILVVYCLQRINCNLLGSRVEIAILELYAHTHFYKVRLMLIATQIVLTKKLVP